MDKWMDDWMVGGMDTVQMDGHGMEIMSLPSSNESDTEL